MSNTYVQLLLNSTGETVSALQLWTALAMAHKAEHAVDLEAGAVVAVTLAAADAATILETVLQGGRVHRRGGLGNQ